MGKKFWVSLALHLGGYGAAAAAIFFPVAAVPLIGASSFMLNAAKFSDLKPEHKKEEEKL